MFAEKHYPETILPEELDSYLAKGWYRMGQTIFTTHFLCFDDQFYSAIWVRLPLVDYKFSKSLRKLLRQNDAKFQTKFRRANFNDEKEKLYQVYRATFPGLLAPSLKDSLLDGDGEESNVFDTYEVAIYDGDRLIAFSFFDLGNKSVASIIGVYDPEYQKHSLGLFTMIKEIQYTQEKKLQYYYPGYIVPGYARFDYKLRIGLVEYYNLKTSTWLPFPDFREEEIPLNKMEKNLNLLCQKLQDAGIPAQKYYYPLFEANLFGFWRAPYFDYPVLINCLPKKEVKYFLMAVFDIRENAFLLHRCVQFDDLRFYFNETYTQSFDRQRYFMDLIVMEACVFKNKDVDRLVDFLKM
ncbi:MAG: hypothetical protein DHS20C18_22000 [Saprospiraceae bacterium]|nr:MAG: hypothetical protein DHS20C18_22000 [Saprospiraceae bacterium]